MGLDPTMILKGISLLSNLKSIVPDMSDDDKGVVDEIANVLKVEQVKTEVGVCEHCGARSMLCPHCGERIYY